MWSYIAGGVFLVLAIYLIVQGIRCGIAVRESKDRLAAYNVRTAALSYGDMTYVDSGSGEVILSVHGIFGGYDQAYDTCKDFCSDYRIIAPSRFGYLGSDVYGDGTPAEQAAAYVELLDKLGRRINNENPKQGYNYYNRNDNCIDILFDAGNCGIYFSIDRCSCKSNSCTYSLGTCGNITCVL